MSDSEYYSDYYSEDVDNGQEREQDLQFKMEVQDFKKTFPSGILVNPQTQRPIKYGGKVHRQLVAKGVLFDNNIKPRKIGRPETQIRNTNYLKNKTKKERQYTTEQINQLAQQLSYANKGYTQGTSEDYYTD